MNNIADNNDLSEGLMRLVTYGAQCNAEFREVFKQDVSLETTIKMVKEEAQEYLEASAAVVQNATEETIHEMLKEAADLFYVFGSCLMVAQETQDAGKDDLANYEYPVELEAATTFIDTSLGIFVDEITLGWCIEQVHQSNMSKLDDEGNPLFRDDGKILKGPNYVKPDLTIAAQSVLKRYNETFNK